MPEETSDNRDLLADEACQVHTFDELVHFSILFGRYPGANTALYDIHLDRVSLE